MMEEFVIKVFFTPLSLMELSVVILVVFLVGAIGWAVVNLIIWAGGKIFGHFN